MREATGARGKGEGVKSKKEERGKEKKGTKGQIGSRERKKAKVRGRGRKINVGNKVREGVRQGKQREGKKVMEETKSWRGEGKEKGRKQSQLKSKQNVDEVTR